MQELELDPQLLGEEASPARFFLDLDMDYGYLDRETQANLAGRETDLKLWLDRFTAGLKPGQALELIASDLADALLTHDPNLVTLELTLYREREPALGRPGRLAIKIRRKRHNLVYLSLGSNLGEPEKQLDQAIAKLSQLAEVDHLRQSSYYQTAPWGKTDQPSFVNGAVELVYQGSPFKLLRQCQAIEREMGRERLVKWGPRLIDIDIIFFGDLEINSPDLIIPHPYYRERDFVLDPIRELKRLD